MATPVYTQLCLPFCAATKRCTRCHQDKPLCDFYHDRSRSDGYAQRCKECERARVREYARAHKAERALYWEHWYATHQDEVRATRRQRWADHAEEERRKQRTSPRAVEARRRWRLRNAERWKLYCRVVSHRRAAQRREAGGDHTPADICALGTLQAGLCYYCGEPYGAYEVDHKTPLSRGGTNWPQNLALSCVACNRSKHDKTEDEFAAWRARRAIRQ